MRSPTRRVFAADRAASHAIQEDDVAAPEASEQHDGKGADDVNQEIPAPVAAIATVSSHRSPAVGEKRRREESSPTLAKRETSPLQGRGSLPPNPMNGLPQFAQNNGGPSSTSHHGSPHPMGDFIPGGVGGYDALYIGDLQWVRDLSHRYTLSYRVLYD